jgi:hypothetical protein
MDLTPQPPDLSLLLPRSLYYQLMHSLRGWMPPPTEDTQDALAHRDNAVIAQVASMLPATADEVELAAECVSARVQARDCMRAAQERRDDLVQYLKCQAQAASMLRQAQSARRRLQSVQAERRQRETDANATDQAAWTEHCAIGLMTDALANAPPSQSATIAAPEPDPGPVEPQRDITAEAEQYARTYPQRVAQMRRLGWLPQNPSFDPPDEDLIIALVTGRSPALVALDEQERGRLAERDKISMPDR